MRGRIEGEYCSRPTGEGFPSLSLSLDPRCVSIDFLQHCAEAPRAQQHLQHTRGSDCNLYFFQNF